MGRLQLQHGGSMKKYSILLLAASGAVMLFASSLSAHAQLISETTSTPTASGTLPADVKPGDWAYDAVQDCAAKGMIAGYPPDGNFLGGRTCTRYEMATIVARILAHIDSVAASGASTQGIQAQIDEAKSLSDEFKVELTVIGTNVTQAQADIAKLQGQVSTLQAGLGSAYDAIDEQAKRITALKGQVAGIANTAYTSNPASKFNISGYIQARGVDAASSNTAKFPQGTTATQGAYNGNYAEGGVAGDAQVRRARLRITGDPTNNSTYAAQLDFSGMTSASSQQVTVREAWSGYTLGDGNQKLYPTVEAGLFSTPFGFVLPESNAMTLSPEKPMAFNDGSATSTGGSQGLFVSQDYDKGVKAFYTYTPVGVTLTYAAISGSGRQNESVDGHLDSVVRAAYSSTNKVVNVGASFYGGYVYRPRPAGGATNTDSITGGGVAGYPATDLTYPKPRKDLVGLDAEVNLQNGAFVQGEFVRGTYEARSYFDSNLATAKNPIGADTLQYDAYVPNNQVQGYYVWGGYTFSKTGSRPLTLGMDYDMLQRSINAHNGGVDALQSNNPDGGTKAAIFFPSGSSFDDVNVGYGALYNLDRAIRLRLWYDQPYAVAHATGTPTPQKIGLTTLEMQVKY
jgi:hypothetical protein